MFFPPLLIWLFFLSSRQPDTCLIPQSLIQFSFSHTFILLIQICPYFHLNMIYPFLSLCRHVFYPPLHPTSHQSGRKLICSHRMPPPFHSLLYPPDPSFPLLHLPPIPLFLSSNHLWSLSSSPLSTSDPPFPHFPALWSLHSPELWGMSLCVSCLCRSLHVWWPRGRDDTAPLEWEGTDSGRFSTNALLNPLQYTMSSS